MQIAWPQFQSKISRFFASFTHQGKWRTSPLAILCMSVILILITNQIVLAQETEVLTVDLGIVNGCEWSDGAGSDLTVRDNNTCRIVGTVTADSVYVEFDDDAAGQDGGKLIIGYASGSDPTTFTVDGDVNIGNSGAASGKEGGLLWIGGDSSLPIPDTGTGTATLTITSSRYLYGYTGSATTIQSNGVVTAASVNIYDKDSASVDPLTPAQLTNAGDITVTNFRIGYETSYLGGDVTNSGTITITGSGYNTATLYQGTVTNLASGTMATTGQGGWYIRGVWGTILSAGAHSGIFNNYGTVNDYSSDYIWEYGELNILGTGTYTNTHSGGLTLSGSSAGGTCLVEENATLSSQYIHVGNNWTGAGYDYPATFNNRGLVSRNGTRSTASTDSVNLITYDGSTITNYGPEGARIEGGLIDLGPGGFIQVADNGFTDDGKWDLLENKYEGVIYGGSSSFISVYQGATFNNSGDVNVGTTSLLSNFIYVPPPENIGEESEYQISSLYNFATGTYNNQADLYVGKEVNTSSYLKVGYVENNGSLTVSNQTYIYNNLVPSGSSIYTESLLQNNNILTINALKVSYATNYSGPGGGELENNGTATINGAINIGQGLLDNNSTANMNGGTVTIAYGGVMDNSDTITKGATGNFVLNEGEYRSENAATLNLNNSTGFQINHANAKAELDGLVDGTSVNTTINGISGYLCVGDYDWTGLTCSHNAAGLVDLVNTSDPAFVMGSTNSADFVVDIENDLTVDGNIRFGYSNATNTTTTTATQGSDSTITLTKDTSGFGIFSISDQNTTAIFNGDLDIKNTIADSDHGYLQVYYGADATLNGYGDIGSLYMYSGTSADNDTVVTIGASSTIYLMDWESCHSGLTGNCALEVGPYDYGYSTTLNIEGGLVINNSGYRTGTPISRIGYITNSGAGNEIVNVKSSASGGGVLVNSTTGTFHTQLSGEINTSYTGSYPRYGIVVVQGAAHLDGTGAIDGLIDTHDLMWLKTNADMSVGMNGEMDANTFQTTIDGNLQLDGTVNPDQANAGNVVVNATGTVTSGPGTSTNFLINANNLTLNTGGAISSDGVSSYGSHVGAGSYGGEGIGREGGATYGTTYGRTRMYISESPLYGEAGKTSTGDDGLGGGGVRINANGNIDISGTISANGADSTNTAGGSGAGGSIILNQAIDHTDTSATFTGAGTISANGGSSTTANVPVGGGGKITINSILYDDPMDDTSGGEYGFTGTIQALGGANTVTNPSAYAAAGTMVFRGDDNAESWFSELGGPCDEGCLIDGTLIVDQGGNPPTNNVETVLYDTGFFVDFAFKRVEVLGGGIITYEVAPAVNPTGCFRTNGTINETPISTPSPTVSCSAYPDKPDTLYINNTYIGAQSADEPSFPSPVDDLIDITPSFSFIARNPTNTTEEYDKVAIQVALTKSFSGLQWNATGASAITLTDSVHDGERTEDFEYAGSPLITNTTYYVRTALVDSSGNQGLWTHRDMGEFYQFEITDNLQIDASGCSNSIALTDGSATGRIVGSLVRNTNGDRYGTGNCTLQASSTLTDWQILFGKAIGTTAFEDTTQAYNIDEIDNAGADCTIDTTGATQEEEYGYNITTNTSDADNTLINGGIQTNATCTAAYNSSSSFFNIENSGSEDAIVKVTGNAISNDADFVLNLHANLDSGTEHGTTYDLDTRMIITTNP